MTLHICFGMLIYSLFIYIYIYIYIFFFWNVNLFRFVKIIVVQMTNVDVKIVF